MSLGATLGRLYRVGGMSDRWDGGLFSRLVMPPLLVFAEECLST